MLTPLPSIEYKDVQLSVTDLPHSIAFNFLTHKPYSSRMNIMFSGDTSYRSTILFGYLLQAGRQLLFSKFWHFEKTFNIL